MWPPVSNPADNPARQYAEFLHAQGFRDPAFQLPPRTPRAQRFRPSMARAIRGLAARLTTTANRLDPTCPQAT